MVKSVRRDRAEGALDKFAARTLEAFSKLTGNRSGGAKGKAARGARSRAIRKGRLKTTAR